MACPQKENGYIPIANELQEQFFRFAFSKRQLGIVNFILRLSYGFNKKDCFIPQLTYFELAGMHKQDIKKELETLEAARVIFWSREESFFSINKDWEQWDIKENKKFKEDQFKTVLAMQLNRNYKPAQKVSKTLTERVSKTLTIEEKPVSKTLTEKKDSKYFTNHEVSKTLTGQSVKHLLEDPANPCESKAETASKDIIKYNIKDNKVIKTAACFKDSVLELSKLEQEKKEVGEVFTFFDENIKQLTPYFRERVNDWIDEHNPALVLHVFKHALEVTNSSGGTPLKLIDKIFKRILETGIDSVEAFKAAEQQREQQQQAPNGRRITRSEQVPAWINEPDEPAQEIPLDDDLAERRKRIEAMILQNKKQA